MSFHGGQVPETTVSVKWIAERLRMETWTHLNHLLYWQRRGTEDQDEMEKYYDIGPVFRFRVFRTIRS
jgi:hypothetical protein